MRRVAMVLVLLAAVAITAVATWRLAHRERETGAVKLHGNVDFRQAELPFNNSERIAELLVEEGDRVRAGQVLGRLDTTRLAAQAAEAQAVAAAQRAALTRLQNGTRPEEIAQARANVQAAEAERVKARQEYDRVMAIASKLEGRAISRQEVERAKAVLDTAEARLDVNRKALALAEIGPRQEDIDQAEAQLNASEARLRFIRQQLKDAELLAPANGVIRTRLMEAGEIATPQRPVYSLAVTDLKWVRAYVSEIDLGRVKPGMAAKVTTDTFPDRPYDGWIGFISPVAEFTPKIVQTEELRPSLVYEVRVYVQDPNDELRLGMPATALVQNQGERIAPATAAATGALTPATTQMAAPTQTAATTKAQGGSQP